MYRKGNGGVNIKMRVILAVIVIVLLTGVSRAQDFSQLFCFGDSLTDTGNTNTASANAEYWNNRYSNGPVWVEYLAGNLGLTSPAASNHGGTNYAVGGATTLDVISQVNAYLSSHAVDTDALYILDGGGNDVVNYSSLTVNFDGAPAAGQAMVSSVNTLVAANAKNIMVMSVPQLGLTPAANLAVEMDLLDGTDVARQWAFDANEIIIAGLESIESAHPDVNIYYFDAFTLMEQIAADPEAYGISNIINPAFSGIPYTFPGTVVDDPSGYFFYDVIHPTTTVHGLVGNAAYELIVPEPLTMSIMALGGTAIFLKRRKKLI